MSSPMQALPTYSQWKAWYLQRVYPHTAFCTYCLAKIELFRDNLIRVGCRVKVWDEQVTETAEGEIVKLTSKIVPMSMTGPGCPECQYLMTKLESEELARCENACKEWQKLHVPQLESASIRVKYAGTSYVLYVRSGNWYRSGGIKVHTSLAAEINKHYQETCISAVQSNLEPWMRALGLTAPPDMPQPETQTRTPSKRQVYIDVTEAVLEMPRAKRREDDTYKVAGL